MKLKDAIDVKHREAERHPFNQKMFKGKLTHIQYYTYLKQLLLIFTELEKHSLPHESLNRVLSIKTDLGEFDESVKLSVMNTTQNYVKYLSTLTPKEQLPHVYLHYLALMFGGQMMKEKVPGNGAIYEFENSNEATMSIRQIQKDEWANEANKALDYFIDILDELYEHSEQLI